MKMDVIFYLLAAMTSTLVQAGSVFSIQSEQGWYRDTTGRMCKLETPNSTTIDKLPVGIATEILPGENVSLNVEYIISYGVFNYIGCVNMSSNPSSTYLSGIPREPGLCYSACRTDYVGISWSKCYCFTHQPPLDSEARCYLTCIHPTGPRCGDRQKHASLYKIASVNVLGVDDGRYCRLFNATSRSFQWEDCTSEHIGLCKEEFFMGDNRLVNWNDYTYRCSYPLHYRYNNRYIFNTDSWIATIKSHIYLKCMGTSPTNFTIYFTTPTPTTMPFSQHLIIAAYAVIPVLVILGIGNVICFLVWKRNEQRQGNGEENISTHGSSGSHTHIQNQSHMSINDDQDAQTGEHADGPVRDSDVADDYTGGFVEIYSTTSL